MKIQKVEALKPTEKEITQIQTITKTGVRQNWSVYLVFMSSVNYRVISDFLLMASK